MQLKNKTLLRPVLLGPVLLGPILYSLIFLSSVSPQTTLANDALLFSEASITYQRGNNYKVGDEKQKISTFEHLSVWSWGDSFFFYDNLQEVASNHSSYYAELAPRISLGNVTGESFAFGPVSDVLIASTFERGSDGFDAWLLGLGLNWNMPGFSHFSSNIYYRDTDDVAGHTWQASLVWNMPFKIAGLDFLFDGYTDIRGNEGSSKSDFNFNPQLKLDVGKIFGYPKLLYSGIEYSHWHNKFGIDGVDERNLSGLLQMRFSFR